MASTSDRTDMARAQPQAESLSRYAGSKRAHGVEGGFEEADVIAVGAVDHPADGDAVAVRGDGPLPAQLPAISGVRARSLTAVGGLVQRPVERDIVELEANDPVERRDRFGLEGVEHAGVDPLVTPRP